MKKLLSIALALMLALGLIPALAEEVTLVVWEADGVEGDFIKQAAEKYTELNPNVKFTFEGVSHTDAVQKLELDGPTGLGADVFAAPHDKLGQIVVGQLALPLSDSATETLKNTFMPAAQAGVTYDGVAYGYPTAIETYALFYNKDLIAEAPKTWEEVVEFANTYNDVANNKFAMVWEVSAPYYNYIFMSAYGADLFGPEGTDQDQHDINSEAAVKGLGYFQSLRDKMLPVKAEDLTGSFCGGAFTETKTAAMYITGPWSIDGAVKAGINLGIAPIPMLPETENPPASFSGIRAMFVSAFSEHPEEAKAFAEFLLTPEMQKLRSDVTSTISPNTGVTSDNPYFAGIMEQAGFAKPMPSIPAMDGYWSSMGPAFNNIWNGNDVKTELDAAAQVVEAIGK
ncbi:MAG: maltose ABC transporter substrate-binding protein [Christensenellales bacterium]|jgi:arabinogalactan oligomer/maltooligosaccharide transport system substrate-binding protein|nr:maltose ABC transporter substrate-binding protein [Clostridiales bacterium]